MGHGRVAHRFSDGGAIGKPERCARVRNRAPTPEGAGHPSRGHGQDAHATEGHGQDGRAPDYRPFSSSTGSTGGSRPMSNHHGKSAFRRGACPEWHDVKRLTGVVVPSGAPENGPGRASRKNRPPDFRLESPMGAAEHQDVSCRLSGGCSRTCLPSRHVIPDCPPFNVTAQSHWHKAVWDSSLAEHTIHRKTTRDHRGSRQNGLFEL